MFICLVSYFSVHSELGWRGKHYTTEPFRALLQTQSPLPGHPFLFPSGQSPQHGFSVYFQLLLGGGFPKMSKSLCLPWKSSQLGKEDRLINNYKPWIKPRYKPGAWGLASTIHSGALENASSLGASLLIFPSTLWKEAFDLDKFWVLGSPTMAQGSPQKASAGWLLQGQV